MSVLRPFCALRPAPEYIDQVAEVPYDVVDRREAAALGEGHPLSFIHVSRAEIDLPDSVDAYDPAVYAKAAENLQKLRDKGVLILDETPAVYIYQQQMGEHIQTGIAATFAVDEYDANLIKKHEKTRKAKEDDRTNHIITTHAQTGPVFLTYRARPEIDKIVNKVLEGEPLYSFTAADGIRHTAWRLTDCDALVAEFAKIPAMYIADGHHRAASASRTRAKLRSENPGWKGTEAANFFLAVAFPDDQLKIMAYNRVVADLHGHGEAEFLKEIAKVAPVTENAAPAPEKDGFVSMYLNKKWYSVDLNALKDKAPTPASKLDAAILQENILAPILGIGDPRTDERIDFVGGIRGTGELVKRVDEGRAAVAFSMRPVSLKELMDIADAGEIMPPKSTWFEPKLRDSIVNHAL
ncbi:DUF1015 domain-containing protein [bacterium]|nr:DUF1015 domain-containing protein [bacterium]